MTPVEVPVLLTILLIRQKVFKVFNKAADCVLVCKAMVSRHSLSKRQSAQSCKANRCSTAFS